MLINKNAQMGEKRPQHELIARCGVKRMEQVQVFAPRGHAETSAAASQHRAEKIIVSVDADLLQCCVCSGPLTTPLFQVCKIKIPNVQCFSTCSS